MQTMSSNWLNDITAAARSIKGKVELYTSSTISKSGEAIVVNNVAANIATVAVNVESKNLVKSTYVNEDSTEYLNCLFIEGELQPDTVYTLSFIGAVDLSIYINENIAQEYRNIVCTGERQYITFTTKAVLDKDNFTHYEASKGWVFLKNNGGNTVTPAFLEVQLEKGETATVYSAYVAPEETTITIYGADTSSNLQTYTPNIDGTVSGVTALAPTMTVSANKAGVVVSLTYQALTDTYLAEDKLSSIQIEKTPVNGSFFGYTISQKATAILLDIDNTISIEKGYNIKPLLGTESELANMPYFTINEVKRDEIKKTITVTAYDLMKKAVQHTQDELKITYPITLTSYADAVAAVLGTSVKWELGASSFMNLIYTEESPPNFGGTETLREVLGAIAQASGTICYINSDNQVCFKQLVNTSVGSIDKSLYFSFTIGKPVSLSQVTSATQLGDNITAGLEGGFNQVIYDNPFLELHTDVAAAIAQLLACTKEAVIYPYSIKWRGNPALDIGDCMAVTLEDGTTVNIFYLGETLSYTGGLKATSEWKETEQDKVTTNPSTLGDALTQTFAKVDKVNKEIEIVASETNANSEAIAAIRLDTDSINASVSKVAEDTTAAIEAANSSIATLTTKVDASITAENVQLVVQKELENGVEKVTTSTGFTFDDEGLTVSKTNSEIKTQITEDGMSVYKNEEEVLTANNEGVKAANLHATTYLIIGNYSRFEDYTNADGEARTGCFWIGD